VIPCRYTSSLHVTDDDAVCWRRLTDPALLMKTSWDASWDATASEPVGAMSAGSPLQQPRRIVTAIPSVADFW